MVTAPVAPAADAFDDDADHPHGIRLRRRRAAPDLGLVAVLATAFVLRLAWVLATSDPPVFIESGDAYSYLFYGRQLAEGGGYLNLDGSGNATAYYPIGYPALLAAVFWAVLHTPLPNDLALTAGLLHVALGTGSVALLHTIVHRTTGSRRTALLAAAALALWPNAIFHTSTVLLETAFTFAALVPLTILATSPAPAPVPTARRLVAFGTTLGLVALVRPFVVPFLLLPAALAALAVLSGSRLRTAARVTAVAAVPFVLVLVPWTLRNQAAMGAPLPFSSNMGDTACIDRNDDAEGGFRWAAHDGCADHRLGEVERNRESTAKAVRWVIEHPGREALQIVRRTRLILGDDHDGLDTVERYGANPVAGSATLRTLADGWFFLALALAVAGLVRTVTSRGARTLVLLGVPSAVLLGIAALLWGTSRFHVPALPYLAAFAAIALSGLRSQGRDGDTTGPEVARTN